MKDKGDMFEQLLRQALSFAEQFTTMEPREMDIIFHPGNRSYSMMAAPG